MTKTKEVWSISSSLLHFSELGKANNLKPTNLFSVIMFHIGIDLHQKKRTFARTKNTQDKYLVADILHDSHF